MTEYYVNDGLGSLSVVEVHLYFEGHLTCCLCAWQQKSKYACAHWINTVHYFAQQGAVQLIDQYLSHCSSNGSRIYEHDLDVVLAQSLHMAKQMHSLNLRNSFEYACLHAVHQPSGEVIGCNTKHCYCATLDNVPLFCPDAGISYCLVLCLHDFETCAFDRLWHQFISFRRRTTKHLSKASSAPRNS